MARAIAFFLFILTLAAQDQYRSVTLEQAAARSGSDYKPALLGEAVRVRGIVQATPIEAPDATYVAILDVEGKQSGLMLVYSGDNKEGLPRAAELRPGTVVEATGVVNLHAGQPVLKPSDLKKTGEAALPEPPRISALAAASFRYQGMLVTVEGELSEYREGSWGDLLDFREGGAAIRVFLPLVNKSKERPLAVYQKGDRVRVKGLVSQFCLRPPYNQFFQLLIASPREVELVEPRPSVSPQVVPAAVLLILLGIIGMWYQQQRMKNLNRTVQRLLNASEEIYGLGTAREVADTLRARLLEVIPAATTSVYHYDPNRKLLERIPDQRSSAPHCFHIEECATALESGIALAVRNKTLLQFPNTTTAELLKVDGETPQSLLVIPMKNRGEVRGALVLSGAPGKQLISEPLQPAAQHLGNDAGHYFDTIQQTALREQHHRGEKLAVAGQLIHGVVTELNMPLERIRDLTAVLPENEAMAIHAQVKKASETVKRIVRVARAEQMDARPVDLRFLFQRLMEEMEDEVRQAEIETELNLGPESVYVLGSQDQLARIFENLLIHAGAASTHSLEHVFVLSLNRIGRNAMIEIEFSGPFCEGEGPDFSGFALGMAIIRGLLQSYGGELRFTTLRAGRYRYDVELPSLSSSPAEEFTSSLPFAPQRGLITALLVEPEASTQRKMLSIFGEMNHRLIPVGNLDEAADLAEKVRFDVVFSSARPDGGTWAELFQRIHRRTPHFVLLSESASETDAEILEGTASTMLIKPVEEEAVVGLIERLQQSSRSSQ